MKGFANEPSRWETMFETSELCAVVIADLRLMLSLLNILEYYASSVCSFSMREHPLCLLSGF